MGPLAPPPGAAGTLTLPCPVVSPVSSSLVGTLTSTLSRSSFSGARLILFGSGSSSRHGYRVLSFISLIKRSFFLAGVVGYVVIRFAVFLESFIDVLVCVVLEAF